MNESLPHQVMSGSSHLQIKSFPDAFEPSGKKVPLMILREHNLAEKQINSVVSL